MVYNECMKKIVLIDDDKLIGLSWGLKAKKAGVDLLAFTSIEDFLGACAELPRDIDIYVDSSLGNGVKGELESQKIAALGFTNIYLATGYEANSFDLNQYSWVKGVISKTPPF